MNWFRKFMIGRYGVDQLSIALLIFSFILTLIAQFASLSLVLFISYIPLGITIFRMLSRNTAKRSMENYKFFMVISPLYPKLKKVQRQAKEIKDHKYFKCPNCKGKLRLPRGRGKVIVTCPKCKTKFTRKT